VLSDVSFARYAARHSTKQRQSGKCAGARLSVTSDPATRRGVEMPATDGAGGNSSCLGRLKQMAFDDNRATTSGLRRAGKDSVVTTVVFGGL